MKTFPTLYKKASTGKMWSWQISVNGAAIIETWGEIGGKQQSTSDTIKEGKNLGRANATTPEEQALLEAEAKWTKKLSGHNYNESREAAEKGEIAKLKQYWDNPKLAVGKKLTVQYQGLTTKNKVPRFPVALRLAEAL